MPDFSGKSKSKLDTCDYRLQLIFNKVITFYDCTIIEGHRPLSRQQELHRLGRSKVEKGKHNESPSLAVDAAPWLPNIGIPWPDHDKDLKSYAQFYHFAGVVHGVAHELNIPIRWGGDWDRDLNFKDQTFDDLVHFELINV